MPDQMLKCKECGQEFVHSERDQEFYAKQVDDRTGKAWDPPRRCKPCRDRRKRDRR